MKALTSRSALVWMPWVAAVVVAALLLGATFLIDRSIRSTMVLVAKGMGDAFVISGWQTLGMDAFPPSEDTLSQFLEDHREAGLRYVAAVTPDGEVLASAGEPVGRALEEGITLIDGRARMVGRVRIPRRRRQLFRQPDAVERTRRRLPRVVYEFEPLAALELQERSRNLFILSAVFSLGLFGLATALSRALRQQEGLREELEHGKRLAALGSMSAVLAHELRNPLASLKGHSQLLAESLEAEPTLKAKADLVVSEAVRLERLMNDLLVFVRSGELRRAATDPADVLRAAVATTGGSARIDVELPATLRPVSLDAARLQQALENVLQNALQADGSGGRVTARIEQRGGETVYTVRDRGPGIAAGEEQRIFEPFVTGKVRGVGLGLAITRRIVELHGGRIFARNHPEGGAVFELTIADGGA